MSDDHVYIRSVGCALPGEPVDNARLAKAFGLDQVWEQWMEVFIGTDTRYLATDLDTGERYCTLAELGTTAARRALAGGSMAPGDIDLIVMATATPDMLMPATVNMIADALGINDVTTFQLQSGCTGAVQALQVASQFLGRGGHRNALVIGGDTCAKHLDTNADVTGLPPAQLVNLLLFGDAAGAVVLGTGPDGLAVIRQVGTRLTGLGREAGQTLAWYGLADRGREAPPAGENYKAIEEAVPRLAVEILGEMLGQLGWTESDFDYLLPPQLSGRMTAHIVEQLSAPAAEAVSCVTETGNTGNALPFLQLERALAAMEPGDRALAIAVESSKWIKGGFAFERL